MSEPIWSGCWLLDDGPQCELSSGSLRIWLPEVEPSWRWALDGGTVAPTREDTDGGVRFSIDARGLEQGPHTLALWETEPEVALFTLELVPDPIELDAFGFGPDVEEALASASQQSRSDAAAELLAGRSSSGVEEVARFHFARILAYDERDPGASAEAVLELLEREERAAAKHGQWGVRCRAALVGLFWGTYLQKPSLTRRWQRLEAHCRRRSAGLGARFDHYLGTRALHEGAYADARTRLSNASVVARRLLPERRGEAATQLTDLYVRTGRWTEAQREVESLRALPLDVCDRAQAESSIGFYRIRARQNGEADLGDPRPGLEMALRLHARGAACENVALYTHDLVKLGFAAALHADTTALRHRVEQLARERLDGKYEQQAAELELELAVAERRFDEVPELASKLEALGENGEPEALWRRHAILARAAIAQGDNAAALAAYVEAEAVLDDLWEGVASRALRARWLSAYRRSALGLMHLRLDADDPEGAACAVRSARLRVVDPRDDSGTTQERCGRAWARAGGEVVFLIVPETDDDWYVFVIAHERVLEVTRVRAPVEEDEVDWWDPWTDALRSARRVRILASGVALRAPLHQLSWRGEPLIRRRSVTFGLDLDPGRTQEAPASPAASVVFADADRYRALGRYLPTVRRAHASLARGGWSPRWVETSTRAPSMAETIVPGGLLVYYGHGERVKVERSVTLRYANDVGSTALLVGRDTRWGTDEVSALAHVPRWAVLLGCEAGVPDVHSWNGGLNLAHALLLAGTHEVLATTGPLDAAAAAEVASPLLAGESSESFELSDALHRVWASSAGSEAEPPFGPMRVWSR